MTDIGGRGTCYEKPPTVGRISYKYNIIKNHRNYHSGVVFFLKGHQKNNILSL